MPLTQKKETLAVAHAYKELADFFRTFSLQTALHLLKQVIKTAASPRYWKGNPSNAIYFFEKLEDLLKAALTIVNEEGEREPALIPIGAEEAPDITAYHQYCGWHHRSNPWYFFPRSLGIKDYANPYRVFHRLAKRRSKKGWKFVLKELSFYTLSIACIDEWLEEEDSLSLYIAFTTLVEAAHLVQVRAIHEVDGEPVQKWRGWQPPPLAEKEASSNKIA